MEDGDNQFSDHSPMFSLSPPCSEGCVIDAEPISHCLPPEWSSSSITIDFTVSPFSQVSENPSDLTSSLFFEVSENSSNPGISENPSKPTLSLFSEISENSNLSLFPGISENPSSPTLSLFSEVSEKPNSSLFPGIPENPTPSLFSEIFENPNLSLFSGISENVAASKPMGSNTPPPPSTDLCLSTPDTSSTITALHRSIASQNSSNIASSSREVNALGNFTSKRPLFQELGEEKFVPVKKFKLGKESTDNPIRQEAAREEGKWITKRLTKSDVNGASRLLLPRQDVNNYILPFMDEEQRTIISQQLQGIDVTVFDMDTQTEHELTFKKWSTDSFQLVKAWTKEFVKRRNLKAKDVISIRWEKNNSRFCFRVQMRNQLDGVA